MTQPALSKSIRRLEQFLEVKLVERHPRGVEPTEFGKALAAHAELIDVEIRHTMNSIAALRGARQGHITVGAAPGSFTELLPQATTALLNRNPDLRVTVVGGLGDTLFAALKQGALDFVVSALPGPPSIRELAHEKLFMDRVTLVARVGHPLAQERRLSPRHLIGQKWVLPNPNVMTRQQLDAFFRERNLPAPEVTIETNSVLHIMSVLKCSDMLSFMPQQLAAFSRAGEPLVPLDLPEMIWHRAVGLSYRRRGFMSPATKALIEELRRMSQEIYGA